MRLPRDIVTANMRDWGTMLVHSLTLATLVTAIGPAELPSEDPGLTGAPEWPIVYGGQAAGVCEWPQAIAFNNCSGTLVHPQLVLYAAHCGTNKTNVRFGNKVNGASRTVAVDYCRAHPNANGQVSHWDYAYCRLAQPVNDVDPTPPAMGCELEEIEGGETEVAIVGFGQTNNSGFGTKHWATTVVQSDPYEQPNSGLIAIGEGGKTICFGDSGGSTFWQHPDGSWRALAITSGINGNCGTGVGIHILMDWTIEWVEEESGMDISPCFDADGTWNPNPSCTGFATDPGNGAGNWNNGCSTGQVGGSIESCGPAYDAPPDNEGPTLEIVAPMDMAQLEPGAPTDFDIIADDGEGFAVTKVWLRINGMDQPVEDFLEPWHFSNVVFNKGIYEVQAIGEDWFANVGESPPITLYVGEDPPGEEETDDGGETTDDGGEETGETTGGEEEDTGESTESESDEGGTSETTGAQAGDEGSSDGGCACSTKSDGSGWGLFVLFGLLGLRRPRARAA